MLTRMFGVAERPFRLLGAQWRDLEKARDAGLGEIAARLAPLVRLIELGVGDKPGALTLAIAGGHLGAARLDDVREPILQGLIGGGMNSTEAGALVANVFDEALREERGPMFRWAPLAFAIVTQALIGLEDEPQQGERKAAPPEDPGRRRSRTARPASSSSTAP